MAGRGRFSSLRADYSPGIRFKTAAAIMVVVQPLLSNNTCLQISAPAVRQILPAVFSCRGTLSWWAVKAWDCSYWLGKLIFAGVINRILLFTLAGEFLKKNLLLLKGAYSKKMTNHYFLCEKVKNHYFFMLKSDKLLLFRLEKCQILNFLEKENKSFTDRGTPLHLPG